MCVMCSYVNPHQDKFTAKGTHHKDRRADMHAARRLCYPVLKIAYTEGAAGSQRA
jgi:hypothetical protein